MSGRGSKDDPYDISDSTDWLETPLVSMAPMDASLRCQVCKDFYKTPMITSCSHTFCSLCIRRCLANDGKCPACRATEQENKLRSNWAIEGLVDEFIKARPALLSYARNQIVRSVNHSPKRTLDEAGLYEDAPGRPGKRTRSSTRLIAQSKERQNVVILEQDVDGTDDDDYGEDDGWAACPVCNVRMKVESIDSHLNRCLNEPPRKQAPTSSTPSSKSKGTPIIWAAQKPSQKLDRLPQLNYSLFKDAALRKKMQDLGISAQGSRQLLERRHAEWVTLWNANCDASRPRKKAELLHELEVWERTQGVRAPSNTTGLSTGSQILHKDFDGASWAAKHNQSYQDLIISARRKLGSKGEGGNSTQPSEEHNDQEIMRQDASSPTVLAPAVEGRVASSPVSGPSSEMIVQGSPGEYKQELATRKEYSDRENNFVKTDW